MNQRLMVWIGAVVITLTAAVYQRLTGPTHPQRGSIELGGTEISFRLPRSHGGEGGQAIELMIEERSILGVLLYRHYKSSESWTRVPMFRRDATLVAELPFQPPAGKLEYFVELDKGGAAGVLPADKPVVIRFRGGVSLIVLVPHVFFMFLAMFFSAAAGIEAILNGPTLRRYSIAAAASLFFGGLALGPVVQWLAFGDLWTGIPFGYDLTDNKTLIAAMVWAAALYHVLKRAPRARWWVVAASVTLLLIFSIPHSALGSELDYASGKVKTGFLIEEPGRLPVPELLERLPWHGRYDFVRHV